MPKNSSSNFKNPLMYHGGDASNPSSLDQASAKAQMATFVWLRKAIIQAQEEQYFMQLASVEAMPKHMGKKIKVYEYIPLLDDRNKNDQGIDAKGAFYENGNLYGSSKDIGKITAALPALSENGGRVNRVGFTRIQREGTFHKFGIFYEFTQEFLDFDSEEDINSHLSRELMNGASKLTEAMLQLDLLAAAGIVHYAGGATNDGTVTGEGSVVSEVTFDTLSRLSDELTDKKCPLHTKAIFGSRLIDTKTLPACRVAYVGNELVPTLRVMKDSFGQPAFLPTHQYASPNEALRGEIGRIGDFRFVRVPDMLHWAGKGATVTNPGQSKYRYANTEGSNKYNIYPILVVGSEAFTTIGFQTDGKTLKFDVVTKMPGTETADRNDPYGETGFSSIKWYYGTLILRPERLAVIKTVARI